MANNIPITQGTGASSVAAETVVGISYQQIEVYGGGGASVLSVNPDGSIKVSVIGTVGASIIGSVPVTLSGTINVSGSVAGFIVPFATSVQGVTSVITGTASVLVLPAPGGTSRNYLSHALITNGSGTATQVSLIDNGKVIWTGWAAANGGGWSENWTVPLPQPTSVLGLYVATSAQASVFVAVNGFTGT